jgi:hypothetical protein
MTLAIITTLIFWLFIRLKNHSLLVKIVWFNWPIQTLGVNGSLDEQFKEKNKT